MNVRTASSTRLVTSEVMTPQTVNAYGKVFGGYVFSKMDYAAFAAASRFAGAPCVTASCDRVDFLTPIEVGELVTFIAYVTYVGRSSVDVSVEVYAENVFTGERRHSNTGRFTMVAHKDGKTYEVPRLLCETVDEQREYLEAKRRRELRDLHNKEKDRIAAEIDDLPDDVVTRLFREEGGIDSAG